MKDNNEKIAALTASDSSIASILDKNNIDIILVGDSLGMTAQGHDNTVKVTLDHMVYHTECVVRSAQNSFIIADMPFGSCINEEHALKSAIKLIQAGAAMIKVEGGKELAEIVKRCVQIGIPVCAHIGLMPQLINTLGNFGVKGKSCYEEKFIFEQAISLTEAGASLIVLECIPASLAAKITKTISIPTIGIGAGINVDGQILVTQDILGLSGKNYNFCKNYANLTPDNAVKSYISDVKKESFPSISHTPAL